MVKHHNIGAAVIFLSLLAPCASAQFDEGIPSHTERIHPIDSGVVGNDVPGSPASVVFATTVEASAGSPWIRLAFDEVELAGDERYANASYLQITSVLDGKSQKLTADALSKWSNTSAYFNGDAVLLELYAYPGTGSNRVTISKITAGEIAGAGGEDICGTTDDRVLSMDPRIAWGPSTFWLINRGGYANRFITCGHCISDGELARVASFNVPLGLNSGGGSAVRFPGPENQYLVDPDSIQSSNVGAIGADYATFQTFANTTTGLHAREVQGAAYTLASSVPAASGQTMRITGYGARDESVAVPIPYEWHLVQKTHTGPYESLQAYSLRASVDTTTGNSGSPVTMTISGQEQAVGILTHSGCTGSGNYATRIDHTELQDYLGSPAGVLVDYTPMPMLETTYSGTSGGDDGGIVFFDVHVNDADLVVRKLHMNINADSIATDFSVNVYVRPQGYLWHTSNASEWTLVGQGSSSSAGDGEETIVPLAYPFTLNANAYYGIAIELSDNVGHRYTYGYNEYENDDLTMYPGAAQNDPFGTTLFSPRTWNGALGYEILEPETGSLEVDSDVVYGNSTAGTGVYMDLTPTAGDLEITSIRSYAFFYTSSPSSFQVWTYDNGSYLGNNLDLDDWTLHGTYTASVSWDDEFTIDMSGSPLLLTGGDTTGIFLCNTSTGGLGFSQDEDHQANWSNSDLEMYSGHARLNSYRYYSRNFSGEISYNVVPNPTHALSTHNALRHNSQDYDTSASTGVFLDLTPTDEDLSVVKIASVSGNVTSVDVDIYTRSGSYVGHTESSLGWSPHGSFVADAFSTNGVSSDFELDLSANPIDLSSGQTTGVFIVNTTAGGLRWTNSTYHQPTWYDPELTLYSAHAKDGPLFAGSTYTSVNFAGQIFYKRNDFASFVSACPADCDHSGSLDFYDVLCFFNDFHAGQQSADCDHSSSFDFFDVLCFLNEFSAGCP